MVLLMMKDDLTKRYKKVKNWDKTTCFVRQRKVIYGKGEDNILGQEKVILSAGEVVHG